MTVEWLPTARAFCSAAALTACILCPPASVAATFEGLGGLQGGAGSLRASDVSADGRVVVGDSESPLGRQAFRWTADTGTVGMGFLPGAGGDSFSYAYGVSADGRVIVGGSSFEPNQADITEAFRWTAGTGMVGLGDLPGGTFESGAARVSADGSVITGFSSSVLAPSLGEAFVWSEATGMVGLGVLGGNEILASRAHDISADGSTAVGWSSSYGIEAFRWRQDAGMVGLGDLPGGLSDSRARATTADGSIVVGSSSAGPGGPRSFRWTAETGMTFLIPALPPGWSLEMAWDVSADGSVVVGRGGGGGDDFPYIWDEVNGMRKLTDVLVALGLGPELAGWDLFEATAVSADGSTVVGWGYHDGQIEVWRAYLGEGTGPPGPAVDVPTVSAPGLALLALALGLGGLLVLRS
jgi:probable HAF family extracellular repeat protein